MNAWIRSASATAAATVMTSSISPFMPDPAAPDASRRSTWPLARRRSTWPLARRRSTGSLQEPDPVGWPVGQKRLADDPRARHRPPEAAVLGVRPVVATHVVVAAVNGDRLREVAGRVAGAAHDVAVGLPPSVADHLSVPNRQAVAGQADHPLDE